jgi:hypothetical protein
METTIPPLLKRKSSSRLSGRRGRFDAESFSLRRKPFFRQGGSWAGEELPDAIVFLRISRE